MTGRRARILVEVVDRYIHTRRPVSSQEIVRVYRHRLSPATIRNELNALEKEGFLYKPHVSAGRVPTVQGFRFFAQWLLSVAETDARGERLPAELQPAPGLPPLPELLRRTALLLAGMTGELGFVAIPAQEEVQCLGVILREVRPGLVLAAAVSELGVTEARLIPVPPDFSAMELKEAEEWLAARMGRLEEEPPSPWQGRPVHLAHQVLAELREASVSSRVFVEGWPQLLTELATYSPEWALEKVQGLLRLLQDEAEFLWLLRELRAGRSGLMAHVGVEDVPELRDFSLVTASYLSNQGILGVAGPLWMDYARAFSAVRYLASRLQALLRQGGAG